MKVAQLSDAQRRVIVRQVSEWLELGTNEDEIRAWLISKVKRSLNQANSIINEATILSTTTTNNNHDANESKECEVSQMRLEMGV